MAYPEISRKAARTGGDGTVAKRKEDYE